jgi:hypothetical protein
MTNYFGEKTLDDDCPSNLGIIIHGIVFFGLFYVILYLLNL